MIKSFIEKCILVWVFITDNTNFMLVNSFFKISNFIAESTKTDIDNAILANIATFIRDHTKGLTEEQSNKLSEKVNNKTSGPLNGISLNIDTKKGLKVSTGLGDIIYNHHTGSVEWGTTLKF